MQPKYKTRHSVSCGLSNFCLSKGGVVTQAQYFTMSVFLLSYMLAFKSQRREG